MKLKNNHSDVLVVLSLGLGAKLIYDPSLHIALGLIASLASVVLQSWLCPDTTNAKFKEEAETVKKEIDAVKEKVSALHLKLGFRS